MSGSDGPDLRLLPLVGGMWVAQAGALAARPARPELLATIGAAVVTAVVLGWALSLPADRARRGLLVLAGAGLGLLLAGLHLARLHPAPLADLARNAVVLRARVVVTTDPVPHVVEGRGTTQWSAGARLLAAEARGRRLATAVPVSLTGSPVEHLRYGAHLRLTARADAPWAPSAHSLVLRLLGPVEVVRPPGRVARATTAIRNALDRACAGLPTDAGALLMGLSVGDESRVRPALDEAMIRSGLAHLTAVSGTNTSLVAGLALAAAAGLGWGWRLRIAVSLAVLAGYVALVRPQPSVLRAAVMGVVALLALSAGGGRRGPPALLAATAVLLVALPGYAIAMGFALSVLATGGLLVVGPHLRDRLTTWPLTRLLPDPVRAALAACTAAHLATLPLAVLMGNGASLVALPANVLVTPLVPVATVLGLAAALVAPAWPAAAVLLAHLASPATAAIAWVAHTSAGLPGGVVALPDGARGAAATTVALLLLALLARARPRGRPVVLGLAAALAVGLLVVRLPIGGRWPPPGWLVLACDVGQGDALLLRSAGSRDVLLVDTGPDDAVTDCLRRAGVRPAAVLLSHLHADHVGGLSAVLTTWPGARVLTAAIDQPAAGVAVLEAATSGRSPARPLRAGDRLTVAGVALAVLSPARWGSGANDASVVARADLAAPSGRVGVLLTGDIEVPAQRVLMAGPGPAAEVVKVPHHGSSLHAPGFAAWTGAAIALVSVGADNDYGHPAVPVLRRYAAAGAVVGRTDRDGALAVVDTGEGPALMMQRTGAR